MTMNRPHCYYCGAPQPSDYTDPYLCPSCRQELYGYPHTFRSLRRGIQLVDSDVFVSWGRLSTPARALYTIKNLMRAGQLDADAAARLIGIAINRFGWKFRTTQP